MSEISFDHTPAQQAPSGFPLGRGAGFSNRVRSRPLLFLVLALLGMGALRIFMVRHVTFCGVPDSCSYLALAQSIDTHHGFVENFIDDLQLPHLNLPLTGIEYWRPGTSFFLLLAHPFGGVTLRSSLVITILAGIVLALAAWRIVTRFSSDRILATGSVLLCLVFPCVFDSSLIADSGLFYAAAVAWFLALFTVRRQGLIADVLALVCVAVAYTVRNDALLLAIPLGAVLCFRVRSSSQKRSTVGYSLLMIFGFLVALVPMHLINYRVLGTAFPEGTSRVLYLDNLGEMSHYGLVTLGDLLHKGAVHLVKVRLFTLIQIAYRLIFVLTGFGCIFLPLLLLRGREANNEDRRAIPELTGGITFLVTLLGVYSFVLPAIGVFSALRTYMGLLPLTAVCIVLGMRRVAGAQWPLLATAIIGFYIILGITADVRTAHGMEVARNKAVATAAFLRQNGATVENSTVLIDDPAQFSQTTGYRAIQLPGNGLQAIHLAAVDLHATHVLIDLTSLDPGQAAEIAAELHPIRVAAMPLTSDLLVTLHTEKPGRSEDSPRR